MITEIRLVSNDGESTARFWSAIFNTPAENLGDGRWRVTPVADPAVSISTARVVEAITRVDLTVVCDPAAPDRLRQAGFDVAHDGSQAVDVNGCDNTVHLVVRGWDGHSDGPWEEPPASVTGHVVRVETDSVDEVSRFLSAWFDMTPHTSAAGVLRFPVRNVLIHVEPVQEPKRQWVPLGSQGYAAAVARCATVGFTVTPSPTHPETAGHVDIGRVTFLLVQLRSDAYYEQLSDAVERGDYRVVGPVEIRGEEPEA